VLGRLRRERKLPYCDHQPVEIGGDDQSGLAARQRQHCAVLVGQHDPARASADRDARAGSTVDAVDVGRPSNVADGADKIRRRGAEGKSITHPDDRERIAVATSVPLPPEPPTTKPALMTLKRILPLSA